MGMVEKTKRALTILQQRSNESGNSIISAPGHDWPNQVNLAKRIVPIIPSKTSQVPSNTLRASFASSGLPNVIEEPEPEEQEAPVLTALNLQKQALKNVTNGFLEAKQGMRVI